MIDEIADAEVREAEETKKKKQVENKRVESEATLKDDDYDELVN